MKKTSKEVIDELCKILDATPKKTRTMTPQEKAEDIYLKMVDSLADDIEINMLDFNKWQQSFKSFAIIAVDEILKSSNNLYRVNSIKTKFYLEVKQEIENL